MSLNLSGQENSENLESENVTVNESEFIEDSSSAGEVENASLITEIA
jgi:hypothetical protein